MKFDCNSIELQDAERLHEIASACANQVLRANVPNGQTYRGNGQKIDSAHILRLGRPWCETNHDILRLAEYRFIHEKIDNNRILFKRRFSCSKFKKNLEASRHKMKLPRPIKTIKS